MAEGTKKSEIETVVTPIFRVSFPNIFEKSDYNDKFGLTAIWEPSAFTDSDKKQWSAMTDLADKASMSFHKKKLKDLPGNFKKPVRDGSEKEDLDGYGAGKKFANMTSMRKPGIVDRNKQPITEQEDFYAGCYARALVSAYAYDKEGGKGVAFGLINVQKVRDGEPFGASRIPAEESFEDDLAPETVDDEIPF